jgi:hypothetical protein
MQRWCSGWRTWLWGRERAAERARRGRCHAMSWLWCGSSALARALFTRLLGIPGSRSIPNRSKKIPGFGADFEVFFSIDRVGVGRSIRKRRTDPIDRSQIDAKSPWQNGSELTLILLIVNSHDHGSWNSRSVIVNFVVYSLLVVRTYKYIHTYRTYVS